MIVFILTLILTWKFYCSYKLLFQEPPIQKKEIGAKQAPDVDWKPSKKSDYTE